ncbi:MAG TPA: recombination protein NinG [Thermodesulfobacteriota bacterium]|nr:recombination protein NinG [Thermodesulfobacteriota bacterium]
MSKSIGVKKPKKQTVSKLKKKAWDVFSKWIRQRDTIDLGGRKVILCYTCGKELDFKQAQAGHFIPGRHPIFLFDERQVHSQCYHCNIGLKGAWPDYLKKMVREYGQQEVDTMLAMRGIVKQFKVHELETIYLKYKSLLK